LKNELISRAKIEKEEQTIDDYENRIISKTMEMLKKQEKFMLINIRI